ncbi:hypothetical protein [Streptomyces sp. H27-D2]|uniref:hypothetical protein n=1 Tax=Streptomyces sp. H27-D2 TaxID=3046304 RepID=UPI002DBD9356|nr:hypothetical protein [Streptomyces sp. H27-D2]MEC4020028.1 hypothetical protein [Streptomyces sp. H27-D2]
MTIKPPTEPGSVITHVTPVKRDVTYDHRAQQAAMPITVHHRDGSTTKSLMVLTPDQMELYAIQLEQVIAKRTTAREQGLQ